MKLVRAKKVLSLFLTVLMFISAFPAVAIASDTEIEDEVSTVWDDNDNNLLGTSNEDDISTETIVESGTFGADGDNLSWKLNDKGVLTISGTGAMNAFVNMSDVPWYDEHSSEIIEVDIEEGVTNIGSKTFQNYPALKKVTLSTTVKSIDYWAFYQTTALTEINLKNVENFGESAFLECTGLTNLDMSGAVNVGRGAFFKCSGLTNVIVGGENEIVIEKQAFSSCTNLATVILGNVSSIGDNAFESAGVVNIDLSSVKTIAKNAFLNANALTSVTFGKNLTSIGNTAFKGSGLETVTVPSSVTTLGNQAFMNCTSLKKAEIGANITVLSAGLFNGCTALSEVTLPSGLTEIKGAVFTNCGAMKEITLPETVTTIANNSFKDCAALTTVYFNGTRATWEQVTIGSTGNESLSNATLICKDDSDEIAVSGINLDKTELELTEGDDATELFATVEPENATDKKVTWTSSDESIATVADGKVKAVAAGTATITASAGEYTAICTVKVNKKETDKSVDLSKFRFMASSQNEFTDGTVSVSPIKQEDGTYWLSVPLCSVYTIGKSISIIAPEDYTDEFKVEYNAYENNQWTKTPVLTTVTSQNGMVTLNDHFVYGQSKVYCSDLTIDIEDEQYVIKLKPYAEIGTISVQNSGNYSYPVVQNNDGSYSTSIQRGDTVSIGVSRGLSGGNLIYSFFIDDEQTGSIQYTPGEEKEKVFTIRSAPRSSSMGFEEISFVLRISITEESYVPRLLNYNVSYRSYSLVAPQGSDYSVILQTENTDGNTIYTWKLNQAVVDETMGNTFAVDTSIPESKTLSCTITNIVDGVEYSITTGTIQVWVQPENGIKAPTISSQPKSAEYTAGSDAEQLFVEVSGNLTITSGYNLIYQWFMTTDPEDASKTQPASEVLRLSYGVPSFSPSTASPGSIWYFCELSAEYTCLTEDGTYTTYKSESIKSDLAEIRVTNPPIELDGTGTMEDPLLIKSYEDLILVRDSVATGTSYEGMYFKLTNDISLGEDWTPIGCTVDGTNKVSAEGNLHAFCGILDGNGKKVTVYPGGLPLFNYVNGATIKNLNIYGTQINGYGLINEMHGVGLSGTSVVIDNVRILSGTNILKSGLLGGEIDGAVNGFAGVSAGYVAKISNCTIESGVTIGYDGTQTFIGSFAGRLQGTIENCVSYATVKGVSYVGGIIGSRDNAMGLCSVSGCSFLGSVIASGTHAGGIVGGGYSNSTAPNGIKVSVQNCNVSGSVTGTDKVGGILGGDSYVAQAWNEYSFTGNSFTGTVSGTGTSVGAIIGYYDSLNRIDNISGNTYSANCGASQGIGYVKYLDTSYENPTTMEGTVAFSTENGTSGCPTVTGCWWKAAHNRTDDPLGKDAAALCQVERSLGDLNGDGQVTNADVAALLAIITAGGEEDLSVADLNGDGMLSNADVAQLLQMITAA